jgi:hypothetical protein
MRATPAGFRLSVHGVQFRVWCSAYCYPALGRGCSWEGRDELEMGSGRLNEVAAPYIPCKCLKKQPIWSVNVLCPTAAAPREHFVNTNGVNREA